MQNLVWVLLIFSMLNLPISKLKFISCPCLCFLIPKMIGKIHLSDVHPLGSIHRQCQPFVWIVLLLNESLVSKMLLGGDGGGEKKKVNSLHFHNCIECGLWLSAACSGKEQWWKGCQHTRVTVWSGWSLLSSHIATKWYVEEWLCLCLLLPAVLLLKVKLWSTFCSTVPPHQSLHEFFFFLLLLSDPHQATSELKT